MLWGRPWQESDAVGAGPSAGWIQVVDGAAVLMAPSDGSEPQLLPRTRSQGRGHGRPSRRFPHFRRSRAFGRGRRRDVEQRGREVHRHRYLDRLQRRLDRIEGLQRFRIRLGAHHGSLPRRPRFPSRARVGLPPRRRRLLLPQQRSGEGSLDGRRRVRGAGLQQQRRKPQLQDQLEGSGRERRAFRRKRRDVAHAERPRAASRQRQQGNRAHRQSGGRRECGADSSSTCAGISTSRRTGSRCRCRATAESPGSRSTGSRGRRPTC